jgi:hypothetical protein
MRPDGTFEIWLCYTSDWRYQFIVLAHELTEWAWCIKHNVTAESADGFDAIWEAEIHMGLHGPEQEAGFDRRCPYRGGHVWGARIERIMCFILGVSWSRYCTYWDNFFKSKA